MTQEDIIALAKKGEYEDVSLNATLEETHISWILLTKKFAFKIKKPLTLSFLDFSTLTKRKECCKRELLLNRRFADIYLNVLPIKKDGDRWHIGGTTGKVVDYAVQMKRLASAKKMDTMLRLRQARKSHIIALANTIASFHRKAKVIQSPFSSARMQSLFNDLETTQPFLTLQFGTKYSSLVTDAIAWSNEFLRNYAWRFQQRIDQGYKRDVHGDLHSGNIFLYRKPVIFDCIEFNDEFRQIDVLNEVAFLCMDLDTFGNKDLSSLFLSSYLDQFSCMPEKEDQQLLRYFKCYRANVRLKVHALAAEQEGSGRVFKHHVANTKVYLELIQKELAITR